MFYYNGVHARVTRRRGSHRPYSLQMQQLCSKDAASSCCVHDHGRTKQKTIAGQRYGARAPSAQSSVWQLGLKRRESEHRVRHGCVWNLLAWCKVLLSPTCALAAGFAMVCTRHTMYNYGPLRFFHFASKRSQWHASHHVRIRRTPRGLLTLCQARPS